MPSAPLTAGVELRLVRDLGADLGLAWVQAANEGAAGDEFTVARYAYDAIADAPEPWAALRAELDNGPFVDLQKLFIGRGRGAPPPITIDPDAILAEEPAP
jgi:hypothetical protein